MNTSISVIIVAYKSQSFIACCLNSLMRAAEKFDVEIIVIDNASGDGIQEFLNREFSKVKFIQNDENRGFGAGCNQGAQQAEGDILMFLNPDTIVSHDLFESMLNVYKFYPNAGIISAMLYDGSGRLLPESARRLPTIASTLKKFLRLTSGDAQYYEPINAEEFQEIPVASGAAMMIREEQFENIKGFDERFFMYAEDVDLSFRSNKKGWLNYLVKSAPVIHLKGESTSKEGWSYNKYFYSTMAAFVYKYKGELYSNFEYILVSIAVIFLRIFSTAFQFVSRIRVGLLDVVVGVLICFGVQFSWSYLRYGVWDYFGSSDHLGSYILYIGIWIGAMGLGGAYWRERSKLGTLKSLAFGVLASLVVYSLVPLDWRFSRVVVLCSGLFMILVKYFRIHEFNVNTSAEIIYVTDLVMKNDSIYLDESIGIDTKIERIESSLMGQVQMKEGTTIILNTDDKYDPVELVLELGDKMKYAFVSSKTRQIVSSHYAHVKGDRVNHLSHHNLSKKTFIFQKRIVDIFYCIVVFLPLIIFQLATLGRLKLEFWLDVINGRKTIVGNGVVSNSKEYNVLNNCLIFCYSDSDSAKIRQEKIEHYSLHYSIFDDCYYILLNWRRLLSAFTYGRIKR